MRFHFPNLTRPKKAAKRLSEAFPTLQLSSCQRAIAVACGYRDWHELEIKPTTEVYSYRDRHWFSENGRWSYGPPREAAERMLAEYGITAFPRLADVLPIMILDEHIDVKGAAKVLDGVRELDAGTGTAEPIVGT